MSDGSPDFENHATLSDDELGKLDIAEVNLRACVGLPGTDDLDSSDCLRTIDRWTAMVQRANSRMLRKLKYDRAYARYSGSDHCMLVMYTVLQRNIGIQYNLPFLEGEYDVHDVRNLFLHGLTTGFGGTCVTLPILFVAIGRRLGYPLRLAETREHIYCRWDDPDGEQFAFEATGRGYLRRDDDHYRQWPYPVSDATIQQNGFLHSFSPREELAFFAINRARCLLDNMRFEESLRMIDLAAYLTPNKQYVRNEWKTATLILKIAQGVKALGLSREQFSAIPYREVLLRGSAALQKEWERRQLPVAIDCLMRIHRNLRLRAREMTQKSTNTAIPS